MNFYILKDECTKSNKSQVHMNYELMTIMIMIDDKMIMIMMIND